MSRRSTGIPYPAREAYRDASVAEDYERLRFRGFIGRYRWHREQRAVVSAVRRLPGGVTILDCPCGIGRWWPVLADRAASIIALDLSAEMLDAASRRPKPPGVAISIAEGDAEALPLADNSVDWVFSHALTKHLPIPVQHRVLQEFSRVARQGVICSFSVLSIPSYAFWRTRDLPDSFPLLPEQLKWIAHDVGLVVESSRSCTTPLGVERTVVLRKEEGA